LASADQVNERLRQFWRLRRHAEPEDAGFSDQYLEEPGITPLDSTKTFVGTNGTYYDERWRFMEWRSRRRNWNWAAALTFGGWLAYRRMYLAAGLAVVFQGLLLAMALNGVLIWPLVAAEAALLLAMGYYGNVVYMQRFRRAAVQVAEGDGDHQGRLAALARSGGTNRRAVYAMGVAGAAVVVAVIGFTYRLSSAIVIAY
jgi:hypothetical protein